MFSTHRNWREHCVQRRKSGRGWLVAKPPASLVGESTPQWGTAPRGKALEIGRCSNSPANNKQCTTHMFYSPELRHKYIYIDCNLRCTKAATGNEITSRHHVTARTSAPRSSLSTCQPRRTSLSSPQGVPCQRLGAERIQSARPALHAVYARRRVKAPGR